MVSLRLTLQPKFLSILLLLSLSTQINFVLLLTISRFPYFFHRESYGEWQQLTKVSLTSTKYMIVYKKHFDQLSKINPLCLHLMIEVNEHFFQLIFLQSDFLCIMQIIEMKSFSMNATRNLKIFKFE